MRQINSELVRKYSEVKATSVKWLWYPYIPYGKITILQGDPGDGKSTMMMNIIAAVSNGGFTPDGQRVKEAQQVIYQCSEDGMADTIKPRLIAAGADCDRVAFLDEENNAFSLDDEKLGMAIGYTKAKLVVIDPFQAYFGESNLSNTMGVRKVMRCLAFWANLYNCAIVLIGHLNKNAGTKALYRSLGSIDIMAVARSVLQVYRSENNHEIRVLKQIKNSLAPKGKETLFSIDEKRGITWIYNDEQESVSIKTVYTEKLSKQEIVAKKLLLFLSNGPVAASTILTYFAEYDICEKTVKLIKKTLGIRSLRKGGKWYWSLDN